MLREKYEKVKEFVVDHKIEIAVGLCVAVGGGVVLNKIMKSTPKINGAEKVIVKMGDVRIDKNLPIPEVAVGTIDELWVDQWGKNLILNDVTVADLGKIGEEFLKIDGVTNETEVSAVIGLLDNK